MRLNIRTFLIASTMLAGVVIPVGAKAANITVSGPTAAIVNLSTGDRLTVTPAGTINPVGVDNVVADGISARSVDNQGLIDSDFAAVLINNGGNITDGVTNSGTLDGTYGVFMGPNSRLGGFNNSGTVNANTALDVHNAGRVTGPVVNSGTMNVDEGFWIDNFSDVSGGILNTGNIFFTDKGVLVSNSSDISGGFENRGLMSGGLGYGLFINSGEISGGILNSGTINMAGGVGISNFGTAMTGSIVNSGTIDAFRPIQVIFGEVPRGITNTATGTLLASDYAIDLAFLSGPTPINIFGGTISGDINDTTPSDGFSPVSIRGNFTTGGNFNVSSLRVSPNKVFTIDNGFTVTLNTMPASSGTIRFAADSVASHGFLSVTNGPIDLSQGAISVLAGGGLANGDEFMIADGTTSIVGGPNGTLTPVFDNSALWDFFIADGTAATAPTDDSDLFLFVNMAAPAAAGPDQDVIDTLVSQDGVTTDPLLQTAIDNMNGAGSQQQLRDILSSVQPPVDGAAAAGAQSFSSSAFGITEDHLEKQGNLDNIEPAAGGTGGSQESAKPLRRGLAAWGGFSGSILEQDFRGGIPGYEGHTAGLTLGLEARELSDSIHAGIALSYAHAALSSSNATSTQTDIDSYQLTLYATQDFSNSVYWRGLAGYALNSVETTRFNVGGLGGPTALGDFSANVLSARVEAGKKYMKGSSTFAPHILMNLQHYDPQSYTETGAGGLNLTVRGKPMDIAELGAGLRAKGQFTDANGNRFMPALQFGYRYDFVNDNVEAISALAGGGAAFSSQGVAPSRGTFNLGVSVVYETSSQWEYQAGYDLDIRPDFYAHSATLRGVYRF